MFPQDYVECRSELNRRQIWLADRTSTCDEATIEGISQRIPLPPSAAHALSFALEVVQDDTNSVPADKAA